MKKMNFMFIFLLMICGGCGGDKPPVDPVNPPADITYSDAVTPPAISQIDESDYTVYYIDSKAGNDANDGLSAEKPFKSLDKIASIQKNGAVKVLLKSGSEFTGTLTLKDLNGTAQKPFIVDIYGGTERPVIKGIGEQAVLIQDDNVRFRNIHITNKTGKRGLRIQAMSAGAMENIQVAGCRFEEINWAGDDAFVGVKPTDLNVTAICTNANFNKEYGGIIVEAFTSRETGASWYENLYLTGNEFFQVCRTGILITTRWGTRTAPGEGYNEYVNDDTNWYPCRNVVIQGNDIRYVGGDGVILMGSDNSFLDHNVCYYANFLGRTGHASAGIWPYSSRNTVMQFNECAYTQWANGSSDGEGMDVDIACKNTTIQYNYIHHNVGGGILMCNKVGGDHQGTVIRNNVLLNNGGTIKGSFMVISTLVGSAEIYNNIVITDQTNRRILFSDDWGKSGNSHDITFRNNIFVATQPAIGIFDRSYIDNCVFENNLYYNLGNFSTMDAKSQMYNPGITVPSVTDGYANGLLCKPTAGAVFTGGMLFDGMLKTDIAGNSTIGISYLGAFAK